MVSPEIVVLSVFITPWISTYPAGDQVCLPRHHGTKKARYGSRCLELQVVTLDGVADQRPHCVRILARREELKVPTTGGWQLPA